MHRKIVVKAHHGNLAARADAIFLADLEQPLSFLDGLGISPQATPAHQQPGPFELVARLHDPAFLAVMRRPVVLEELPQSAITTVDEPGERQSRNLVCKSRPWTGRVLLLPGQHGLEEVHMRIGAKRRARRIFFLEASNRVSVVALKHGKDFERAGTHLFPSLWKRGGCLCRGKKCKGLIVEIERWVDQLAGLVCKVAVKAVFKAIDLLEPREAVDHRVFPRSLPAMLACCGEAIGLPRLHAGAAIIGKNRLRILVETLVEAAVRTGRPRLPPQRQCVVMQPLAECSDLFGKLLRNARKLHCHKVTLCFYAWIMVVNTTGRGNERR